MVGHSKITSFLQSSIESDRLVDVYLFTGQAKLGKNLVANLFLSSLVCQGIEIPCLKCFNCKALPSGACPDFLQIRKDDDKKQIGIEQVRELISRLSRKPVFSRYQLAVIHEADKLTTEACNALLKTLEEPKAAAKIILLSDTDMLLPTVKSRCQVLKFLPVSKKEMVNFLAGHPKLDASREEMEQICELAAGRIGWAIDLATSRKKIDAFKEDLGNEIRLATAPMGERFKAAEKLADKVSDNQELMFAKIKSWELILRAAYLQKSGAALENKILPVSHFLADRGWTDIIRISRMVMDMPRQFRRNVNTKMILENFYLNI